MSKSVGLDNIVKYLESERDRFYNAYDSDSFCDGEHCRKVASVIASAIEEIERVREGLKC
ncbi:MAG: hypothetical protein ACRDD7_06360 [Peptostreptococcaceae bacterium]